MDRTEEEVKEIIIPAIYLDALVISTQRSHRFLVESIKSVASYLAENTIPAAQAEDAAAEAEKWKIELAKYSEILKILGAEI